MRPAPRRRGGCPTLLLLIAAALCGPACVDAADDLDDLFVSGKSDEPAAKPDKVGLSGFLQFELAATTASPDHWSKARARLELGSHGRLSERVKWKMTGRVDYDAVFFLEKDFYAQAVRDDQLHEFQWRETYLDINAGNWDFRLGRQHVVWGEMIALFFADVVSARDMREFILPELDQLRIPQWAMRAEYFQDDFHAEMLWVPYPSYDLIGKPADRSGQGSDFFFYPPSPPGALPLVLAEDIPSRSLRNSGLGLRASQLTNGWDLSGFYYRSYDVAATMFRQPSDLPNVYIYQPRHLQIHQSGATFSKDFGNVVFKGEAVYTTGRRFPVTRPSQPDGLIDSRTLDYALGLDYTLSADNRLNLQFSQRVYSKHETDMTTDRVESGVAALFNHKFANRMEGEVLAISSLNRADWLLRPKFTWNFVRDWRWVVGADVFKGPPTGLFGQFDNRDRVYTEVRRSF